jgi:hypothetical protein
MSGLRLSARRWYCGRAAMQLERIMKDQHTKNQRIWAIAALCALSSVACGDKSKSEAKAAAQMAGQSAKSGVEAASDATKEAADKTKAAAEHLREEAREDVKEAKEKSADALEKAAEKIREE